MNEILESIYQFSGIALLICAIYYYFHFKKTKKERKLTKVEFFFFVVTQISFLLFAASWLLKILDKG
ncbi:MULTISPECIES: hypothetical protein [unclassified Exiguobacterium]|uniref:hypothetical protein n=1 Tax=unclassified Exiguobacterium TaxID=2644629 RepID=UPI001BEA9156|nr:MULTISPECIES: hypothetical protein [unclassified Exiguobacterium]